MTRHSIRHIILFLILLLASCGVKREVVSQPEQDGMVDKTVVSVASEDVALSLEQRIAAGEFAWLDTIVIDAEKIDLRVQGSYKLDRWVGEEDLYKNNPSVFTFFIDSIVFIHKGCYYKAYKEGILADYGRFITRKFSEEQVCLGDSLQRFYNVSRITLDGKVNALRNISVDDTVSANLVLGDNKYDVLIVAQPTQPFREYDKYIIDQFIMRGGKVLWLIDNTTASLDSLQHAGEFFATPRALYINDLFFTYGVRINTDLIQDLSCMPVPQQVSVIGDQPQYKFMAFPYSLDIVNFGNHPIVRNLKDIKSDFAGSIDLVGNNADLTKTVLMTTSERTKVVPTPSIVTLKVGMVKPNLQEYSNRNVPIAVLVEGNFQSAFKGILPIEFDTIKELDFRDQSVYTRQIFVSDGDIIRNPFDSKRNQPYPAGFDIYTRQTFDNTQFIVNCVNYLCADDDLLQLRAKNFKIGSLNNEKTRNHKVLIAALNIGIPLLLIALMGTVLIITRKVKFSKKS